MAEALAATYRSLAEQAVGLTGAASGWLLRVDGDSLVVLATAGAADPDIVVGSRVEVRGARGFAIASGQTTALMPAPGDQANAGVGGWAGVPPSLLVGAEGAAVLEVAGKIGADAFTFDDIEALAALGEIAAAAVADAGGVVESVPPPGELATQLAALSELDPARYRDVARVVAALLG